MTVKSQAAISGEGVKAQTEGEQKKKKASERRRDAKTGGKVRQSKSALRYTKGTDHFDGSAQSTKGVCVWLGIPSGTTYFHVSHINLRLEWFARYVAIVYVEPIHELMLPFSGGVRINFVMQK